MSENLKNLYPFESSNKDEYSEKGSGGVLKLKHCSSLAKFDGFALLLRMGNLGLRVPFKEFVTIWDGRRIESVRDRDPESAAD